MALNGYSIFELYVYVFMYMYMYVVMCCTLPMLMSHLRGEVRESSHGTKELYPC